MVPIHTELSERFSFRELIGRMDESCGIYMLTCMECQLCRSASLQSGAVLSEVNSVDLPRTLSVLSTACQGDSRN